MCEKLMLKDALIPIDWICFLTRTNVNMFGSIQGQGATLGQVLLIEQNSNKAD